jgi:hypothetical protein
LDEAEETSWQPDLLRLLHKVTDKVADELEWHAYKLENVGPKRPGRKSKRQLEREAEAARLRQEAKRFTEWLRPKAGDAA